MSQEKPEDEHSASRIYLGKLHKSVAITYAKAVRAMRNEEIDFDPAILSGARQFLKDNKVISAINIPGQQTPLGELSDGIIPFEVEEDEAIEKAN